MNRFMRTVAIIGGGKGGSALLSILVNEADITLVGIADKDPNAPAFKIAKDAGIFTTCDIKDIISKKPDIIINVTGDNSLNSILRRRSPKTEVIDGNSAKFIWDLLEKRRQARAEVKERLNETRELYRIGIAFTSADRLEEALEALLLETLRTLNIPAGSIALYDEEHETLTLKAVHGFSTDFSNTIFWKRRPGGMTDHILSKRIPTIIPDTQDYPFVDNKVLFREGIRSIAAVPLYANEHIIGILYLDDFKPREWSQREVEFITLLGIQAAYAIEKFRLIETVSETKTYLKNVLDNSADIIITTDTEGRIVEYNSGAARILGYTREEIIGKKAEDLWVRPSERTEILNLLQRQGYVTNYETQFIGKDGRVIEVSLTLSYIRNGGGNIIGTVGISKDITEKKRLERAVEERNIELQELNEKLEEKVIERTKDLEKANRELERLNRLKSQFIATMSHELRTPLNSILGFSELLSEEVFGALTEKQKQYVNNIYNSGSYLLQLINNILDIAKIESGKMKLFYESFSVNQAISDVETVIKPLVDKKRQNLITKIADDVSFIKADKIKFKQVLYNLLSNAVKFTPEGGDITIEASLLDDKTHKSLKVSVTDTGIGIRKEDHDRIFSEFEQVDSSFSRRYEGTGLGLALTKKLVELHGGEILLESPLSEEGGSRFTITIPITEMFGRSEEKIKRLPIHAVAEDEFAHTSDLEKRFQRRSETPLILVVEDDMFTSELLTHYLTQGGYKTARAYSGDEAIKKIRELRPFAVILDVMLPGKDGWEILQELKSDPELKDIPVIMSSVIDNQELGFALGASDYLVKPIDKITLLKKLEELSFAPKKRKRPITILCIDDHQDVLDILLSTLEPAGYNVITANSGRLGLEKAVTYRPDLIILDLMMLEMDGFEVAHELKVNPVTMDIPILILTAKDLTVEDRLRLVGKAENFMQKSHFTKEDLLARIKDLELLYPKRAGLLDEISGLFDHSYFQIRLAQEVSRAERYKNTFTMVMLDLDAFTEYIKAHGMQRANVVIKKIAEFLRKTLRGSDTIVRYGIDEFAIILPNTLKEHAETVAKRLVAYIDIYPFYGEEIMPLGKVTASASVITYPQDAATPEELISRAQDSLRKAKADGGRRVEVYAK